MKLRTLLVCGFMGYGLVLLLVDPAIFGSGMATTVHLLGASSLVLGLLFLTGRCFALNLVLGVYVATKLFLAPWVESLMPYLESTQVAAISDLVSYYDDVSSARVSGYLLWCLVGWLAGLMVTSRTKPRGAARVPRVFQMMDAQLFQRGMGFWTVIVGMSVANTMHSYRVGWGIETGEGSLFFGLASPAFIINCGLLGFVYALSRGLGRQHLALLLPILPFTGFAVFMGSRSAIYWSVILISLYSTSLKGARLRIGVGAAALLVGGICAAFAAGAVANGLRPLWRSGASVDAVKDQLQDEVSAGGVVDDFLFPAAVLVARAADLKAPFSIINDKQLMDPWPYVNPIQVAKRTINGMVPGEMFPDLLTINQLFDWIYGGIIVTYNSENWSIFGMAYLYFGFFGGPVAFFVAAVIFSGFLYEPLISRIRSSPSFATFAILLIWDFVVDGTVERAITVHIWPVVLSSLIFTRAVHWLNYLMQPVVGLFRFSRRLAPRVPSRTTK